MKPSGTAIALTGGASVIGRTVMSFQRTSIGAPWCSWNAICPLRRKRLASPSVTSVMSVPLIQCRTRVPRASTR